MKYGLALGVLLWGAPALAETYTVQGTITDSGLSTALQRDETVTFTFSYEPAAAVSDINSSGEVAYFLLSSNAGLLTDVVATYRGTDYPLAIDGLIVSNQPNTSGLGDSWSPQIASFATFDSLEFSSGEFRLFADESTWSTDAAPSDLTTPVWTRGSFGFVFGDRFDGLRVEGVLDLDSLQIVAAGPFAALIDVAEEAAGEECEFGGIKVTAGTDDGLPSGVADNGVLEAGEVDATEFVCNGAPGANGVDGEDGAPGADGEDGAPGTDGEDGMNGVDGRDGRDGATGQDGAPGAAGENGHSSLLEIVEEAAGDRCPSGGQRVDVGLDDGAPSGMADDGILDAAEIDGTTYLCTPAVALSGGGGGCSVSTSSTSSASMWAAIFGVCAAFIASRRRR